MKTKAQQLLELKIESVDFDKPVAFKDYMKALLITLFDEEEGFSGKRPWGNSGWLYDVYYSMIKSKLVSGSLIDGYVEEVDEKAAKQLIEEAINEL